MLKVLVAAFCLGLMKMFFSNSHLEALVSAELMFSSLVGVLLFTALFGESILMLLLFCVLVVVDGVMGVSLMVVNFKNHKDSLLVAFLPGAEYK